MSRPLTVSFFGVTVPIPPWTVGGFGVVALAGVSASLYQHLFPFELRSLRQANEALAKEVDEYGRHLNETPSPIYERDGLTLRVYNDHCLLIAAKVGGEVETKLIPSLAKKGWAEAPSPVRLPSLPSLPSLLTATLHAQGRCQNPHPGNFQTRYGTKRDCWVEVVRTWDDGCEHVQMLNSCSGAWDANADGSPRVRWTRCQH